MNYWKMRMERGRKRTTRSNKMKNKTLMLKNSQMDRNKMTKTTNLIKWMELESLIFEICGLSCCITF